MASRAVAGRSPRIVNSSVRRIREYFTPAEIKRLMATARKASRYGHRDATMILMAYRHGLRASELGDLQCHQVELTAGRLHVRRTKRGNAERASNAGRRNTRSAASTARANSRTTCVCQRAGWPYGAEELPHAGRTLGRAGHDAVSPVHAVHRVNWRHDRQALRAWRRPQCRL
jgi:integrase-like protein